MKTMAKCVIKVLLGLCLLSPTFSSPLLLPHSPLLRSTRLSNALSPNAPGGGGDTYEADWVKITVAPPRVVQQPMGTRLELECEAVGSRPMIQWIRGDSPLTESDSYESNVISEAGESERQSPWMSKIRARLVISSVLPPHQGPFTCVASSGSRTIAASTAVIVLQGKSSLRSNFSALLAALPLTQPPARVVLWSPMVMAPQGSDVLVPCRAVGEPSPDVFWLDNNEELVTGQDPRVMVLSDGQLRIKNLSWGDMGAYSCVARNAFSKDSILTFIYPLLNEN